MGGIFSQELKLAKQLQELCDDDGKEIEPNKSAYVLHEFGLLYKSKSPDKICLIQSAAFLNAAIVRQPSNLGFQKDLQELCHHVLHVAGAENQTADLIAISCQVQSKVQTMRDHIKVTLEKIKNISFELSEEKLREEEREKTELVRNLQSNITEKYTEIMDYIASNCVDIMGEPPCKYSITGMGSLARKEITPFSDFEHIIILEEGSQHSENYFLVQEYFRWLSVVFHIIVINLKETILRSVAIPLLNDDSIAGGDWFFDNHTPCGIKFDGMQLHACKFPLGRKRESDDKPFTLELIKSVSEMVKFVGKKEALKHGYHLADMLTTTCFVSGSRDVHNQFEFRVKQALHDDQFYFDHIQQILDEVLENLNDFDSYVDMAKMNTAAFCNIKRVVYRTTTLFISALAKFQKIDEFCCFEIVERMFEKQLLSSEAKHKLMTAIAVACECRLKVYMLKGGQDDFVGERSREVDDRKTINMLTEIVGEQSLGDYFEVAYSLQNALKNGSISDMKTLQCTLVQKFGIFWFLDHRDHMMHEWKKYVPNDIPTEEEIYVRYMVADINERNNNFVQAFDLFDFLDQHLRDNAGNLAKMKAQVLRHKAGCLFYMGCYDETLTFIEQSKNKIKNLNVPSDVYCAALCNMTSLHGYCNQHFKRYETAIASFKESLSHCQYSTDPFKESLIVFCLSNCSLCLMKLEKFDEAIGNLNEAIKLFHHSNVQVSFMLDCYSLLGQCYLHLQDFGAAFQQYQLELDLRLKYVPAELHDFDENIKLCKERLNTLASLL